ncbi:MAG: Fpg/Nei family DNA glycosylase [Fimbriimonas sp.]
MPELPEVETVRRVLRRALGGKKIVAVEVPPDEIVLKCVDPEVIRQALIGRTVVEVGRKGKTWWLELDEMPWVYGHLGMAGWIRQLGKPTIRLREHGEAPFEDPEGRPRFLKLLLEAEDGERIAFTDGRRLARLWLGGLPANEKKLNELGPDMFDDPWTVETLAARLVGKKAPIKAVLLDQTIFCGVGNWIADEVLYQARIAPKRLGGTLDKDEIQRLIDNLADILTKAVDAGADHDLFPKDWLFHVRWDGKKGTDQIGGEQIVREAVGGRTTAWVPSLQH